MKKAWVAFSLICLLLVLVFAGVFSKTASAKTKQPTFPYIYDMQEISDGVFVSTGEYIKVNVGLIISGNEAVIIDTGLAIGGYTPTEALRVKQYLEENNIKVKYILLTHEHLDHIGNISMFETEDTITFNPSNSVDGQLINFGDKVFRIIKTNGHFNNAHMSIEMVDENILFAGDVVVTNLPSAVAFQGNFKDLFTTLEMLRTKNFSIIVPGHGDIIDSHETINMNLEYIKNVEKYVLKVIKNGGTLEDVMRIKLEDCVQNTEIMDQENMQFVHEMSLKVAYYEYMSENR